MKQKTYLLLHLLFLVYAASSVCGKWAAGEAFLSLRFLLFYGGMLLLLAVYALGWQQAIKRLPLTVAYASKAVTVIWGLIAGLTYSEMGEMSPGMILDCYIWRRAYDDQQHGIRRG